MRDEEPKDAIISRLESLTHALSLQDAAKETLFALSKDCFVVIDISNKIKYVNPAFAKLLETTPQSLVGDNFNTTIHPAEESGKSESNYLGKRGISRITHITRKSRDQVIIDWNSVQEPVSGDWYCVGRDATDLIEYRDDRERTCRICQIMMFRGAIDQLPVGIFFKDRSDNLVEVNEHFIRMLGLSKRYDQIKGSKAIEVWNTDKDYENDLAVMKSGKEIVSIETAMRPDGSVLGKYLVSRRPWTDPNGSTLGVIGTILPLEKALNGSTNGKA